MNTYTVTVKRLIYTKYKIKAKSSEEAEKIIRDKSERLLEEKDFAEGTCISMDIEIDSLKLS